METAMETRFFMILQLTNPIDVETPLGYGKAIAWIDYGSQVNTVWKVVLYADGRVRNFYDDDVFVHPNKMDGGNINAAIKAQP